MPAMANPAHSTPNSFRCDVSLCINFSCQRHRMNDFSFVVLLFCGVSIHAYVLYSSKSLPLLQHCPIGQLPLLPGWQRRRQDPTHMGVVFRLGVPCPAVDSDGQFVGGGEMTAVHRKLDLAIRPLGAAVLIVHEGR